MGTRMPAGQPMEKPDGTRIRTLWGELAYQLGGKDGFAMVAGADETSTNPGAALRDLLKRYAPCVILVDEWVAYARQLPQGETTLCGGSFETQFTFAQTLSQEVKATNGALLVFTLPISEAREQASDIEVGGSRGREALNQLRNAFGRIQANWQPADASESYAIVRRRLFEPLKEAETKLRDRAVSAIYKHYREKEHSFPKYASEPRYREKLEEMLSASSLALRITIQGLGRVGAVSTDARCVAIDGCGDSCIVGRRRHASVDYARDASAGGSWG